MTDPDTTRAHTPAPLRSIDTDYNEESDYLPEQFEEIIDANSETVGYAFKEADGVLWATSPELLNVLKNILILLDRNEDYHDEADRAWKLIAKANGK